MDSESNENINISNDDIRQFIAIQLADAQLESDERYFEFAIGYFEENLQIPSIETILNNVIIDEEHDSEMTESDTESDSDTSDQMNMNWDKKILKIDDWEKILLNQTEVPIDNLIDVKKVINDIETVPINMFKNLSDKESKQCLICYDTYVDTDIVRILPCSHKFHRQCIDEYLENISYLCPYCEQESGESKFIK